MCNTGFRVHGFTGTGSRDPGIPGSPVRRVRESARGWSTRIAAARSCGPRTRSLAFDHGLSLGADGLEFDVHLSRDGVVVVHHDPTLDRTTNGTRPASRRRPPTSSAALDAGYHFDGSAARLGGVPRLDDVLRRYPVPLIIELKVNEPELAHKTIDAMRAARCGRSRRARIVRHAGAARGPRLRAAHPDRLVARGNPPRAVSIVGALAGPPAAVPGIPGARDRRAPRRVVSPRFVRYAQTAGSAGEGVDG